MWPNPQETTDLVTFTGEILNEKLRFLYSGNFAERGETSDFLCSNFCIKTGKYRVQKLEGLS